MMKISKKICALILVIILMSGLLSFNASAINVNVPITEADTVADIQARINAALAITTTTQVTVTGSNSSANSILNLTTDVPVLWNAVYKGIANPVIDYYGTGTLTIGPNGWVQNTSTSGSVTAIRANGNNLTVSGGTVQSGRGRAIEGAGPLTVVNVTSGSVFNEATSNLFPVIDMTNASNINRVNVTVSGSLTGTNVFAAAVGATAYGYVIQSYGNITISGGTLSTSGGYGRVINLVGPNSNVTVSGGVLEATGVAGTAISTSTTLADAYIVNTSVTITGGLVASYATGNGWAIHTTGSNSTVTVSGGTVFGYGNIITGANTTTNKSVIYTERRPGFFLTATGTGVVIAWNRAAGQRLYYTGTFGPSNHITTSPTGVETTTTWQKGTSGPPDGIRYTGSPGFIPLPEVKVVNQFYSVRLQIAQGGDTTGNEISMSYDSSSFTVGNPGPSFQIINNIPYNQKLDFIVNAASVLKGNSNDYVISFVDIYPDITNGQYSAQHQNLHFGTAAGGTFNYELDSLADFAVNQVFRAEFVRYNPGQRNIVAFAGVGGYFNHPGFNQMNSGSSSTFTITAHDGYYISGVVVDGQPVNLTGTANWSGTLLLRSGSYTFTNIQQNHVITATFLRKNLNITATADAGGSISPQGSMTVPYGESRTFSITPGEGYFIQEVLIDGVRAPTTQRVQELSNVTSNRTIHVTFALNGEPIPIPSPGGPSGHSLSAISGDGGTVTGTPSGIYAAGHPVIETALANDGFHFTGWTITGAEITGGVFANPATFNMPDNSVVLTANFEPNPPGTFTLNVVGGAGGTLSGTRSGAYAVDYAVSVTATANPGYRFVGWTITGADITGGNDANPAEFFMPGNMVTITAIFEEIDEAGLQQAEPQYPTSPQTGVSRYITLPIVILAFGAILIAGAELYRRRLFRKEKQQ